MPDCRIRTMEADDRFGVAELIYTSINYWYQTNGRPPIFQGGPQTTEIFYEVYEALDPGCGIVAENTRTGALMGSCFIHPRQRHVSLGIMNCHPNYFGCGVASKLLQYVIDFSRQAGKPLRLTQSAINLDSFSLYNKAGFVPRLAYQDMYVQVPQAGFSRPAAGDIAAGNNIRDANLNDIDAIAALELEVSGLERKQDYRYCIENQGGIWRTSVFVNAADANRIDGFLISCSHPAMNMIGPGFSRSEEQAAALIDHELDFHRGRAPVVLIPVECEHLVRHMYGLGARNCELHFCQVLGDYQPYAGVNLPSFLPETG